MQADDETRPVLVIDLDGTLIRSDMLYESFWSSFARDWRTPLRAVLALSNGRAALKERMAECGIPDPATLPYTPQVLDHIRAWRASGGRTALVTAADQSIADAISNHLGLFDETHGSDGKTNLKGPNKAAFLNERFGAGNYIYAGDSPADIPVWQSAQKAITVGADPKLRAEVARVQPNAMHLAPPTSWLPAALKAMRPHQWLKNMLVFLPLLVGHGFSVGELSYALLAFIAFSLVASSVYLLNDLLDIGADRAHPRKCERPLASGALPLPKGMAMVPALLAPGLLIAACLGAKFFLVLILYYALTIAYSLWLKRQPVVDICSLAVLYTFRVVAGATATGIDLSVWLVAFSAFLFLSLAAVKRQAELTDLHARGETVASGRGYRVGDLPLVTQMAVSAGFVAALVMVLYVDDPGVRDRYGMPELLWGTSLVMIFWISRMVLIAHRGKMHDDPIVFAARDKTSIVSFLLMAALVVGATVL